MNKMKVLLWREFMLGRKRTLFSLLTFAMLTVLCWLTLISVKHGNIAAVFKDFDKEMPGMSKSIAELIYYAAMYVPAFMSIPLLNENGVVSADLKSGWKLFSRTLPVTPAEKLGAKYILKGIFIAVVILINMGNFAVVSLLADKEMTGFHIKMLLLLINVGLLSELIKCAVLYPAKTEKGMALAEFASVAALIIACIPYFRRLYRSVSGFSDKGELTAAFKMMSIMADDMEKIFPFMIPVMIVLLAGGYFVHLMIIRRADK